MSNPEDPSDAASFGVLFGEDELGVVVRAHIHIEAKLLELLELLAPAPTYLERMDLDFGQRVNLVVALGLKAEHAAPLSALGRLRNVFAHRLDAQLSDERVNSLYETLSAGDKEIVQASYVRTNAQLARSDAPSFKDLSARERFITISVALRAMLMAAIRDARNRAGRQDSKP
jgi:hypothetical protein